MRDLQVAVRNRFAAIHRGAGRRALDELVRATPRSTGAGGEEGHLADDWRLSFAFNGASFVATLSNDHQRPRPEWIDQGTAQHFVPRSGLKLLAFDWPNGPAELRSKSGKFFFMRVDIPAREGVHFIERTLTEENWSRWLEEAAQTA